MKKIPNDHYTYRIIWSPEDSEYVGLCAEFPSLSWLSNSPEAALKGIRSIVSEVINDMIANHETLPEPLSEKNFSGKFMVRIPSEAHRKLALEAAEEGVSLNRLVSFKLTQR
jgi:predicted HicB family RNase H-like nuclease